jgi:peptide/nickel transport system permease protein
MNRFPPLLAHFWGKDRAAGGALIFLVTVCALALLADPITWLLEIDPDIHLENANTPPFIGPYVRWWLGGKSLDWPREQASGKIHWLGTDHLGRDLLAGLLYGGQISLGVPLLAGTITVVLGSILGALAGYCGGWLDRVVIGLINLSISLPGIYILIVLAAIFKPSPWILAIILGILGWWSTARLVRGEVLQAKEAEYVLAARCIGGWSWWIIIRHIIPNNLSVIIVHTAMDVGDLILLESALSFLGLGIQQPHISWGYMLENAKASLYLIDPLTGVWLGWYTAFIPGVLIVLTVLAIYQVGDSLRDLFDPIVD